MILYRKRNLCLNAFFQKNQIEKLTGIYFPYWVCDAEVEGSLTAEGNKVRVWVSGDEEFTETRIYRMEREGPCVTAGDYQACTEKNR